MLPQEVIEMLRDKSGSRLRYWLDINVLCMDIKRETGQTLSIVMMKRLLGLIDGEYKPQLRTLDTIAHFLGSTSWNEFIGDNAQDNDECDKIISSSLRIGNIIYVEYERGSKLELRYNGEMKFVVKKSEKSPLRVGEILEITSLTKGCPLVACRISRKGKELGLRYMAAKVRGITSLKKRKKNK
jgi:hypothetical protein